MGNASAKITAFIALTGVCHPARSASADLPMDRPYTLRNSSPAKVEGEFHRMLAGDRPRSYILPRPCERSLDSSRVCDGSAGWSFLSADTGESLSISPVAGYEYRYLAEHASAWDLGLNAAGTKGPVAFQVDARMFTELHQDPRHPSYDREGVDRQDTEQSGSVAYTSYSRYRAGVSYAWDWGRLTAGRDAAHWGPGLLSNLVFNQASVPFNQLTFTTQVGPIILHSLYGRLTVGDDWATNTSPDTRSVFGHRYEWQPWPDLLLGASEQLILHNASAPFAFIPVVPLFMAKQSEKERMNNGNIAFDASLRFPGMGALYTEFLIDDIQSPGTLFGDHWGEKWGWLAGAHLLFSGRGPESGAVLEYARIEPWVYTHYQPNSAQAAHFEYPLGNQDGPNSQSLRLKVYARWEWGLYLGLSVDSRWKGTDSGSGLLHIHPDSGMDTKAFLAERPDAEIAVAPTVAYRWRWLDFYLEPAWSRRFRMVAGLRAAY